MATNIRRFKLPMTRPKMPQIGAIGEPDAHVFNCPKCARPLTEGTPRCPGCGVRLIMGVVLRRAGTLMVFGFIVGALIGGSVMSLVISTLVNPATAVATVDAADDPAATDPSGAPVASQAPAAVGPAIPAPALSSLRQSTLLDARIAADADALSEAYRTKASAVDIALILRSLASEANIGSDLAPQLRTWDDAHKLSMDRGDFYDAVGGIARDGLRASMSDKKDYRATAKTMLSALRRLVTLDAESRALATTAGVDLPPVDLGSLAP